MSPGQPGDVHPDDEAAAPPPDPATVSRARTDRQFVALVRALQRDDPRFVRRCSAPVPGRLARTDVMIIAGMLATLLLGVVPLAVGLHLHAPALLVVGALASVTAPVLVPWLTRRAIVRHRPLWV